MLTFPKSFWKEKNQTEGQIVKVLLPAAAVQCSNRGWKLNLSLAGCSPRVVFCLLVLHSVGKVSQMSHFSFSKNRQMDYSWHFSWTLVHSKCKCSSLRSPCWMRLFQWFSNNVMSVATYYLFWGVGCSFKQEKPTNTPRKKKGRRDFIHFLSSSLQ